MVSVKKLKVYPYQLLAITPESLKKKHIIQILY